MDDVFREITLGESQNQRHSGPGGGVMQGTWTVFKREPVGYFTTPVAFVFLIIFRSFPGVFFTWSS
ncbi:MAG: hypothetical protein R3F49_02150 [Planctomycetota bacterium]